MSLQTFDGILDKNPHYWRDVETVQETAAAAQRKWHITAEPQVFGVRVRKADDDPGLEFVTLIFEVQSTVVLVRVE